MRKQRNRSLVNPYSDLFHIVAGKIGLRFSLPILADPYVHGPSGVGLKAVLDLVFVESGKHFGKHQGFHVENALPRAIAIEYNILSGRDAGTQS